MAIGGNSWMTGNLGWLPDVSPPDAGSDTLPRHYVYDYHGTDAGAAAATVLYTTIGVIYNRVAAAHACPDGWRLPTDDDWLLLDKYLAENGYGYKGSISQTAKAMSSSELWTSTTVSGAPGNSRDPANLSGFQAIPAPGRTASGTFSIAGIRAAFWVAGSAQYRYLSFDRTDILTGTAAPAEGFSVRCVKNSH